MKTKIIVAVVFLLSVLNLRAQLRVSAGNDTTFCESCIPDGTVRLGTTMKIVNGTPPYTYKWTTKLNLFGNSYFYAKTFLNDTTLANPVVKSHYFEGQWHPFYLEVTDANQQHATDTILVRFSSFIIVGMDQIYTAQVGDVVDIAGGGFGGGILPYKKYRWSPTIGLSSPDSLNTKCKVSGTMTYILTVTDSVGCTTSVNAYVKATTPVYQPIFGKDSTRVSYLRVYESSEEKFLKDTIIDNLHYREISRNGNFLRVSDDNSKAYIKPEFVKNYRYNQSEYLVMDLNMKVGDTFIINDSIQWLPTGEYMWGNDTLTVDSVYTLNGLKHIRFNALIRVVSYELDKTVHFEFVEGIGPNIGFFYRPYSFNTKFSNNGYDVVLCVFKDGVKFYSSDLFKGTNLEGVCNLPPLGIPKMTIQTEIRLFPNPAKDQLTIEVPETINSEWKAEILNLTGRVVSTVISEAKVKVLNISCLPASVYLVRLTTEGGKSFSKPFVVKR